MYAPEAHILPANAVPALAIAGPATAAATGTVAAGTLQATSCSYLTTEGPASRLGCECAVGRLRASHHDGA